MYSCCCLASTEEITIKAEKKYFPACPLGTVNLLDANALSVSISSVAKATLVIVEPLRDWSEASLTEKIWSNPPPTSAKVLSPLKKVVEFLN